jgi:hypothetical protein
MDDKLYLYQATSIQYTFSVGPYPYAWTGFQSSHQGSAGVNSRPNTMMKLQLVQDMSEIDIDWHR